MMPDTKDNWQEFCEEFFFLEHGSGKAEIFFRHALCELETESQREEGQRELRRTEEREKFSMEKVTDCCGSGTAGCCGTSSCSVSEREGVEHT